jgi:hypothetical protein
MKWAIRIELTRDGNKPITYDIGTISRPIADLSSGIAQLPIIVDSGNYMVKNTLYWRAKSYRYLPTKLN